MQIHYLEIVTKDIDAVCVPCTPLRTDCSSASLTPDSATRVRRLCREEAWSEYVRP
jgi:hypothetical protein